MPQTSRSIPTTSWLVRNWEDPFTPSKLAPILGVNILNAVAYHFCMACCILRCYLLYCVQYPIHTLFLTSFIVETISSTSSGMTMTTICRFRMLAANLSPLYLIVRTTWLVSSRRDYLNCESLLCLPQPIWKSSNNGMPEVNVYYLVCVRFLTKTRPLLFLGAIVNGPLCNVYQ